MTTIVLGKKPAKLEVNYARKGDYGVALRLTLAGEPIDWPVGTVLTLVFENGVTFTAVIADEWATFDEDKATIAAMALTLDAQLIYTNGTTDRVLAIGMAQNHG